MTDFKSTFFASPKDAIFGGVDELDVLRIELHELSRAFSRLGMATVAEELDNHAATIERASTLIRRACSHVQNN